MAKYPTDIYVDFKSDYMQYTFLCWSFLPNIKIICPELHTPGYGEMGSSMEI